MKKLIAFAFLGVVLAWVGSAQTTSRNFTFTSANLYSPPVPAAGASGALVEFESTLNAMDGAGGDVVDGLLLDITNAVHTGGTFHGLRLDNIVASAAQENAVTFGTGWDLMVNFTDTNNKVQWPEGGWFQLNDAGGTHILYINDTPWDGASGNLLRQDSNLFAMDDAGDIVRAVFIDIDNENHTNGTLYGIDLYTDAQDPQADEVAIYVSGGWDYDWRSVGVVQANLGAPADGTFVYCTDCTIANPCAAAGNGAFAKRLNGVWVCN